MSSPTARPAPQAVAAERRGAPRRRVLKGAFLSSSPYVDIPGTVRDISESGARIQVQDGFAVPARFQLRIALDGLEAACTVVRRDRNEIAVRFLEAPRKGVPTRMQVVTGWTPARHPANTLRRTGIAA
jgi:hypothetical protein